jgi:hypothetical protein
MPSLLDAARRDRVPRSEILRRPLDQRYRDLRELVDGIAADPDRIVRLARAQMLLGNARPSRRSSSKSKGAKPCAEGW